MTSEREYRGVPVSELPWAEGQIELLRTGRYPKIEAYFREKYPEIAEKVLPPVDDNDET